MEKILTIVLIIRVNIFSLFTKWYVVCQYLFNPDGNLVSIIIIIPILLKRKLRHSRLSNQFKITLCPVAGIWTQGSNSKAQALKYYVTLMSTS